MLLVWPSRISRFLNISPARIACKGRIKKLDKASVNLTAFRPSVRAAMKVVTYPTSLKEPNTQVVMWNTFLPETLGVI